MGNSKKMTEFRFSPMHRSYIPKPKKPGKMRPITPTGLQRKAEQREEKEGRVRAGRGKNPKCQPLSLLKNRRGRIRKLLLSIRDLAIQSGCGPIDIEIDETRERGRPLFVVFPEIQMVSKRTLARAKPFTPAIHTRTSKERWREHVASLLAGKTHEEVVEIFRAGQDIPGLGHIKKKDEKKQTFAWARFFQPRRS